jgi:hypothetical protein
MSMGIVGMIAYRSVRGERKAHIKYPNSRYLDVVFEVLEK